MTDINTGGPAYPHDPDNVRIDIHGNELGTGMTLRDYFAGRALMGWISGADGDVYLDPKSYAEISYEMADAMIAARSKS